MNNKNLVLAQKGVGMSFYQKIQILNNKISATEKTFSDPKEDKFSFSIKHTDINRNSADNIKYSYQKASQ